MKKKNSPFFSRFIEHDKCQGTIYKGPKEVWTMIVQMRRTFLWDLRGWYKQTFQKRAFFKVTIVFDLFFVLLSSVKNIKEQLLRVHKFFWHLLWYLLELFVLPGRLLKTESFEKKQSYEWRKDFGLFFSGFTKHEKFMEIFISVHKVCWQFLCKWQDHFLGT